MPLTADSRFVLLKIKVERAKKHIRDLETTILDCRDKRLYAGLSDDDPQTGQIMRYYEWLPVFPFEVLSIAGDAIHNLRSALDHLTYQLAIVGSGKPPGKCVQFPFANNRDAYESEKARKVEGIRPEAVKAIDDLRPYKGGDDVLWRIHELDNIDKHRFVFVIGKDVLFEAPWYNHEFPFLIRPRTLNTDAPLFSGIFESEVEQNVNFSIEEAVCEPQVAESNALLPSLRRSAGKVESIICDFRKYL
jgi:hypothetical protein